MFYRCLDKPRQRKFLHCDIKILRRLSLHSSVWSVDLMHLGIGGGGGAEAPKSLLCNLTMDLVDEIGHDT